LEVLGISNVDTNGLQNAVEFRGGDLERKKTESFKKEFTKKWKDFNLGMNIVYRFAHPYTYSL